MRSLVVAIAVSIVAAMPGVAPAARASDPMVGAPKVGACTHMNYAELEELTDPGANTPCSATHTGQVELVWQLLPDTPSFPDPKAIAEAAQGCWWTHREFIGRTQTAMAISTLGGAYFIPSAADQAAGARWFSCYAYNFDRAGKLAPLPANHPLLPSPITKNVQLCLRGAHHDYIRCTHPHQWKATGAVELRGRYPGKHRRAMIAARRCPALVTSHRYFPDFPSRADWKSGNKILVCYSQTRR